MKLAIVANPDKYAVKEPIGMALSWADANEHTVYYAQKLRPLYEKNHPSAVITDTEEQAVAAADIVLSIGGDGTMLYTARLVKNEQKPVLGVNSGRLGFMANTQQDRLQNALNTIEADNYSIDKRFLLQATDGDGNEAFALNEFLFSKKDATSMITIDAEYDGMFVNKYWADGLIVATPTGSTAYNLSSDGPIVMPNSNVMVVTPINPHTLTTRPLVLPSSKPLKITIEREDYGVLFSYDGRISNITDYPFEVRIQQSNYFVQLIQLPDQNYFNTLRQKLMWGQDYRKRG